MPELTITIPTYNRNAALLRTVHALLPQLTPACRLVVLDNASPEPAAETLRDVLAEYPAVDCELRRNRVNIGGCANVTRCFEICETEWLWILGDDDEVLPDAIATILATVSANPTLTYINFAPGAVGDGRAETFVTTGLEEFAMKLDRFGHSTFISACVYNAPLLRPRLNQGYFYAYSSAPHTLMLLMSLGSTGKCLFTTKKIVGWEVPPPEQQPASHLVWPGFMILLETEMAPHVRSLLANAILRERPPLLHIARELYNMGIRSGNFDTSVYRYDQLAFRFSYFDRSLTTRLQVWTCRLPLAYPRLFASIKVMRAKLTGRRTEEFVPSTRTE